MKKFKNYLLLATGIGLGSLMLVLTYPPSGGAQGVVGQPLPVQVVNEPSNPVPVRRVEVFQTRIQVEIKDGDAVNEVENIREEPFGLTPPIPAGKRFVIRSAWALVGAPVGQEVRGIGVFVNEDQPERAPFGFFLQETGGTDTFFGHVLAGWLSEPRPVLVFVNPDGSLGYRLARLGGTSGPVVGELFLSGFLEDVP